MTTTTAAVIIEDALKENVIISEGETPSAAMYADGLRMLNRLYDTLSNHDDFAYYASQYSMAMTGQRPSRLAIWGRPDRCQTDQGETAVVTRMRGITYPVKVIDNQRYDELTLKTLTGANTAAIYTRPPTRTERSIATRSRPAALQMRVLNQVKNFALTSTQIDMPEGYEDFLMLGLAIPHGSELRQAGKS